jgi:hypothetical protein
MHIGEVLRSIRLYIVFFSFLGGGMRLSPLGTSATKLAYCTSTGLYMMSVEQSVEWELVGETAVFGENLPQCRFVHHKSTWPELGLNLGRCGGKPVNNRLSSVYINPNVSLRNWYGRRNILIKLSQQFFTEFFVCWSDFSCLYGTDTEAVHP